MNVRRLFPFALFVLLAATAIRPTIDPDMWWHLKTGQSILANGIPHQDIFSFTAFGNEWVAHEWLSEVIMWGLYRLGGLSALMVFFAAVTTATWWLVYLLCDGKPYVAGMVVAVAAKASQAAWGSRPQLFNLLFLAAFVFLMERRKDARIGPWVYWAFPAAAILWANLHSGYLLGIVVLATYFVGESLEGRRSRSQPRTVPQADLARLGMATVAAIVAALVNPNGARLWTYPFETLGSTVQRDLISEWFPPTPDQLVFWVTVGLIVAGLVGMVRSPRRPSATELLFFAGTAIGAFLSVRNIPIFAIVAAPIVARYLADAFSLERFVDSDEAGRPAATAIAGAVLAVAAGVMGVATLKDNDAAIAGAFPVAAVDYIEANQLGGNIFNAYNFGGYLIWRDFAVYVDGRADVYRDEGLLEYATTAFVEAGWEAPLERYDISLALVESGSAIAAALADSPAWEVAYGDGVAVLYLRSL